MKDVQKLIDEKKDLNQELPNGKTILHQKAFEGKLTPVQALVENGANVVACDKEGFSPLHMACCSGSLETVQFLLANQAHDVIVPGWGNQADATTLTHETCVGLASKRGALDVVRFLVDQGFCFDKPNDDGNTPLFLAMQSKYKNVATYLMDKGADIHRQNARGETLLSMAIWSKDHACVYDLFERGADINQPIFNVDGVHYHTPLSFALYAGNFEMADWLIEKGADVNKTDLKGNSPLSIAVERFVSPCYYKRAEYGRMVNLLVQKKANPTPLREHYNAVVAARKLFETPKNAPRLVLKAKNCVSQNERHLNYEGRG